MIAQARVAALVALMLVGACILYAGIGGPVGAAIFGGAFGVLLDVLHARRAVG